MVGRQIGYKMEELLSLVDYSVLYNKTRLNDLVNWINNNDESVNYILNNKHPSRSAIGRFLKNNKFIIEELSSYIVELGV